MKSMVKVIGLIILVLTLSSCKPGDEVEVVTFDVSFVLPEGMTDIADISVVQGQTLTLPQIDELGSYEWYEDSTHETLFDTSKLILNDLTLYLSSDTFDTIEYRGANKFFNDNLYEIKGNIYDPNQVTHLIPELEGHTFIGWYHDKEFTSSIEDNPFVNMPEAQNYIVYAKYEINIHTFTKIVNEKVIYQIETEYGKPLDLFFTEKLGLTFDGWYLDQEYLSSFDLVLMPDEDITLYGKTYIDVVYSSYLSYDLMFERSQRHAFVEVSGIVTSSFMNYMYITDGKRAIKVEAMELYDVGTELRVIGLLDKSITSMTITDLLETEVLETNVENPLSQNTSTIEDILYTDGTFNDYMGYQFTVTGRLQFEDGNRIGISDGFGNHLQLQFQNFDMYEEILDLAGYIVSLEIIVDDYDNEYLIVLNKQTIEEIEIVETKDDQDSFDEDIVWIKNNLSSFISYRGFDIPRFAINGSEITLKSWSHPQFINDYNYITSNPENGLIMTVTLQITKGDLTQELSHEVRYVYQLELESLMSLEESTYVNVVGFVYATVDKGIFIGEFYDQVYIFISIDSLNIEVRSGDYIEVVGLWEDFILSAFDIKIIKSFYTSDPFVDYFVSIDKTITQIIGEKLAYGAIVSTSAYIEYHEELDEVWLKHHEDDSEYVVVNTSSNDELLMEYDGQYIELQIIIDIEDKVLFIGVDDDITIITEP